MSSKPVIKEDFMELKIYYLHYNTKHSVPKDRPQWFSYENCLKSLLQSLRGLDSSVTIKLRLVFDGPVESFGDDFSSQYFSADKTLIVDDVERSVSFIFGGSGPESSRRLLDLIFENENHGDDDLIYILENDYLHLQNWVGQVLAVVNAKIPFDYLSLYDHADKYQLTEAYNGKYDSLKSTIYFCKDTYWRTTPSTCFSFISTAKVLHADKFFFKKFKDRLIHPFLRLTRGRILISALPGLSTHCMSRYLSPGIPWHEVSTKAEKYWEN